MLISEQKPMEEILSYLSGEEKVFIVGCKGCAEGCQTGGEQQAIEMKQKLEEEGKTVTGISLIDFACNEQLTRMTLQAHESKIVDSDSLLMLCCGIGVQAAASVVDKVVHPGCNTVSLGGRHGEWRDGERCHGVRPVHAGIYRRNLPHRQVRQADSPWSVRRVGGWEVRGLTPTCPAPGNRS